MPLFVYLGEDRLYLNTTENDTLSQDLDATVPTQEESAERTLQNSLLAADSQSSVSKQWLTIAIPHAYISSSWPIR